MYQKILVPYDKSMPARNALRHALSLVASVPNARITVLNVIDWHDYRIESFKVANYMSNVFGSTVDNEAIKEVVEAAWKEAKDAVAEDIADIVADTSAVDVAVTGGSPHDSITAFASEGDYDCIVMGHRGLGAVRNMLGSVCYSVLYKTDKPVLIVQ